MYSDADAMAHKAYAVGNPALAQIADAFGPDLLTSTGELDRKKLGAVVFADRSAMKKLERIVWPATKVIIQEQVSIAKTNSQRGGVIVVEAAVLLDAEWQDFCDGVWMITADKHVALQRLVESRNMSLEDASQRWEAQQSRQGIRNLDQQVNNRIVTAVVDNSGSLDELKERLQLALNDEKSWY